MRPRNAATLATLALLGLAWTGCQAKKQTELVAGISTQVRVPKDLKTIRVDVSVGGSQVMCDSYRVYDGKVQLPRTLGALPLNEDNRGNPVTITVAGYSEERSDSTTIDQFIDCANTPIKLGSPPAHGRILRSSRQTYSSEKIIFVPMPLSFACFDRDQCGADETCKGGRCVTVDANPDKAIVFSESMINGGASTCFSIERCVTSFGQQPVSIDQDKCIYALPNTKSAPPLPQGFPTFPNDGEGLNVRAFYDGGQLAEVLDLDPDEGFFIPDPAKPQQFQLAPGLCELVKGVDAKNKATAHRISGLVSSGLCQSKTQRQPICDSELNKELTGNPNGTVTTQAGFCRTYEVKPTPNALVILLDGSERMTGFYTETTLVETLRLSLADPAFESTQLGLKLFPQDIACGAPAFPKLDVDMASAVKARADVAGIIDRFAKKTQPLATGDLKLDTALKGAYAKLREQRFAGFARRGVLVLGNRNFDSKCPGAGSLEAVAAEAFTKDKIGTYVLLLGDAGPADAEANLLVKGGGTPKVYDARNGAGGATEGAQAFDQMVRDLSSCLYDVPQGKNAPDPKKDLVSYFDPLKKLTVKLKGAESCTSPGSADAWTLDSGRIRFCQNACSTLGAALKSRTELALALGTTPLPVPIFVGANCGE